MTVRNHPGRRVVIADLIGDSFWDSRVGAVSTIAGAMAAVAGLNVLLSGVGVRRRAGPPAFEPAAASPPPTAPAGWYVSAGEYRFFDGRRWRDSRRWLKRHRQESRRLDKWPL